MISTPSSRTLVQERESTFVGQQGMAAARLAMKVRGLLHQGMEASGITQKELADRLGVGESRVSQILSSNGNIQISTLAKVLRGIGYKVELSAVPADSSVPPMPARRARKTNRPEKKTRTDTVVVTRGGSSGVSMRNINFTVPVDDFGAFYEVTSVHSPTRRPVRDSWEIDWEEIDWDEPVTSTRESARKGVSIG